GRVVPSRVPSRSFMPPFCNVDRVPGVPTPGPTLDSPGVLYAFRCLVGETFRQAVATRVFWIMLVVSGLFIVFCLGVSIDGAGQLRPEGDYLYNPRTERPFVEGERKPGDLGHLNLLFGMMRVELHRDAAAEVHLLQVIFGTWVAGACGLLLTLVWTAG